MVPEKGPKGEKEDVPIFMRGGGSIKKKNEKFKLAKYPEKSLTRKERTHRTKIWGREVGSRVRPLKSPTTKTRFTKQKVTQERMEKKTAPALRARHSGPSKENGLRIPPTQPCAL